MNRYLFTLCVTVKDGERAFVTRDGRFERVLEPGRHTLFDPARRIAVELYNVMRAELPAEKFAVLKAARPDLAAELFELVEHGVRGCVLIADREKRLFHSRNLSTFAQLVSCQEKAGETPPCRPETVSNASQLVET